jgi:Ca2+/Na+ antiporter
MVNNNSEIMRAFNAATDFKPFRVVSFYVWVSVVTILGILGWVLYFEIPLLNHSLALILYGVITTLVVSWAAPTSISVILGALVLYILAVIANLMFHLFHTKSLPPWAILLMLYCCFSVVYLVFLWRKIKAESSIERISNSLATESSNVNYPPSLEVKRVRLEKTVPPKVRTSLEVVSPGDMKVAKNEPKSFAQGPLAPTIEKVVTVNAGDGAQTLAALLVRQGKDTRPQGDTFTRMFEHARNVGGLFYELRRVVDLHEKPAGMWSRWIKDFPGKKKEEFEKAREENRMPGYLESLRTNFTSVFTKIEKVCLDTDEDGNAVVKAPRIIISPIANVKVACGPVVKEITRQIKVWFAACTTMIYAPGNTNDVIGDKFYRFWCRYPIVVWIENDLSKADASVDRPVHREFKNEMHSWGVTKLVCDLLHPEKVTYVSRDKLVVNDVDPRLGSGRDNTSFLMTLFVLIFWEWFLAFYKSLIRDYLQAAGGDDSLVAVVPAEDVDVELFVRDLPGLIIEATTKTSLDAAPFVTREPHLVTFYSKVLVPCFDTKLRRPTWCLMPMPGRLIARLGLSVTLLTVQDKVAQFTALWNDCKFAPFIGPYLDHFRALFQKLSEKDKRVRNHSKRAVLLYEEWATHNNNLSLAVSEESYIFFSRRYGLTKDDEISFIAYLETIKDPYTLLYHPVLQALVQKDN